MKATTDALSLIGRSIKTYKEKELFLRCFNSMISQKKRKENGKIKGGTLDLDC